MHPTPSLKSRNDATLPVLPPAHRGRCRLRSLPDSAGRNRHKVTRAAQGTVHKDLPGTQSGSSIPALKVPLMSVRLARPLAGKPSAHTPGSSPVVSAVQSALRTVAPKPPSCSPLSTQHPNVLRPSSRSSPQPVQTTSLYRSTLSRSVLDRHSPLGVETTVELVAEK